MLCCCCCCPHARAAAAAACLLREKWTLGQRRLKALLAAAQSSGRSKISEQQPGCDSDLSIETPSLLLLLPRQGESRLQAGAGHGVQPRNCRWVPGGQNHLYKPPEKARWKRKMKLLGINAKEDWVLLTRYFLHTLWHFLHASVCSNFVSSNSPDLSYLDVNLNLCIMARSKEKCLARLYRDWRKKKICLEI